MSELVQIRVGGHQTGLGATCRVDDWKTGPTATFLGLSFFIVYATWAGLQGAHYYAGPYLSPLYSPVVWTKLGVPGAAPLEHALLGEWPAWWPALIPATPAALILIFPGSFRFTCYYYRKAYYRAFGMTPPGCAVGALPQSQYKGETALLIFQNLHRYALYFAILFIFILYYDAALAFSKDGEFGFGVGTLVLLINPTLLAGYTFGCHSWRHLIGGGVNLHSKSPLRHSLWKMATVLNERHMLFAWLSLFWVGFTDFYVRMVSMGVIADLNTWS